MKQSNVRIFAIAASLLLLAACSGDEGAPGAQGPQGDQGPEGPVGPEGPQSSVAAYTITLTNLSHGQPMAPIAFIMHEPNFDAFMVASPASLGLEILAEGGDPSMLISEAADTVQFLDAASSSGILMPGKSSDPVSLIVPVLDADNLRLSVATMLVDTNDAFAGVNASNVSNLSVGQSMTLRLPTWDAGTEINTETAATMPGPAATNAGGGGSAAGFNAARDDLIDAVRIHAGVVTSENANDASMEGLASSVLDQSDKFDNPSAQVVITRAR